MSNVELHRTVRERLARRDQRYTTGRRQIVEALVADGPITLPALLSRQPSLAQSSAYRNLSAMEEAGVVRRLVHGTDYAHYELAEDLTEHHHHLICEQCGVVRDIILAGRLEHSLGTAFDELASLHDFVPRHHIIDIYGRCADCSGGLST